MHVKVIMGSSKRAVMGLESHIISARAPNLFLLFFVNLVILEINTQLKFQK